MGFCNADEWNKLDKEFFTWVRNKLSGKEKPLIPNKPKEHQLKALKEANDYFIKEKNTRGKLIFPCGAGKSLTGYWITRDLKPNSVIVAVPSLSLVKYTLEVYLKESVANKDKIEWLCVCTDEGIGKNDDVVIHTNEIGVPCITDKVFIANWLKENNKKKTIIFTTYQSGKTISEACKIANHSFDLGILDEAHKTVGDKDKLFSYLLFDKNIKISKRIFMTATEKRYAGSSDAILSMDDPDIYGETFAALSFKQAIDLRIISDYKIITLFISDKEVRDLIEKNAFVKPTGKEWNNETEARTVASLIALRKAMKEYPIHHAVTFHSSIKKAEAFEQSQPTFSNAYPKLGKVISYHVSGAMPTSFRSRIINEFANSKKAIITNAKCLTEGIDVPNIDCVLFVDPRKTTIDIVQAVGRALRKKEGKEYGYVILPVFTKSLTKELIIESDEFAEILTTIRALAANDERIIEYFRDISRGKKVNKKDSPIHFNIDVNIAEYLNEKDLVENLELITWSKLAKLSWMPFGKARKFVHSLSLKSWAEWSQYCKSGGKPEDIPANPNQTYKNTGWKSNGDWLGTGTIAPRLRVYRPFNEARKFVHSLNLKGKEEWKQYGSSGKKPKDIPASPNLTYASKGWKGYGDWLGTGTIAPSLRVFRRFKDARKFVHSLGLKNWLEWSQYCKSGGKLEDIPANPNQTYKNTGWKSNGDWLGTGTIAPGLRIYKSFNEARRFVHSLGLKSLKEWRQYCKSGEKPVDIPVAPNKTYEDNGWISAGDWLGTGTIAPRQRIYKSFNEARKFVYSLGLKSWQEWIHYCQSGVKPQDIPASPKIVYKMSGWKSLGDWLGTGRVADNLKVYRPFKDARKFVHSLGLKSWKEWSQYCKSREKPEDIPTAPNQTYKNIGWRSNGDWLGTGSIAPRLRIFKPFYEARKFAHSLGLKGQLDWNHYCKSGEKPEDIPADPAQTYKNKGRKGYGDWLGTGRIADNQKVYMPFKEAKKFVHSLGLKNGQEWKRYCKSGEKPENISASPHKTYKDEGWKGFGDWLGTGSIAPRLKIYRSFIEARKFAHLLGLKGQLEWRQYCKSGKKPEDIPANPDSTYENKGWKGYGDWVGTGTIAPRLRIHRSFEEARKFVHSLGLNSMQEWRRYCKSGKKPEDVPTAAHNVYKVQGWKSYGDWLGTGAIAPQLKVYIPFEEAKKFVHSLGLKSESQWRQYCKSGEKPDDIPYSPQNVYKISGWKSIGDWLGTGSIASQLKTYMPFSEARKFVHFLGLKSKQDWKLFCNSGKKPEDIPANPNQTYEKQGWKGYEDWLGRNNNV